nr:uncharacterized protein LOC112097934 [Ipomoea trifida]
MFIAGLKSTIRREVQRQTPRSLIHTFALASEIEAQHGELRSTFQSFPPSRNNFRAPTTTLPPSTTLPPPSSRSFPPIPNPHPNPMSKPLPIVHITPTERQAKIARGECYTCDQKWSKTHKSPNRSLLLMCTEEDNQEEQQPMENNEEHIFTGDCSSLNSMAGPGAPRSLRLTGIVHGTSLQILIDRGNTHNFIQPKVAEQLQLPVCSISAFRVYIGNGDSLRCTQKCDVVPLWLQDHLFTTDLFILPVKGPDIVLGVQWLQELGKVTHDYAGV